MYISNELCSKGIKLWQWHNSIDDMDGGEEDVWMKGESERLIIGTGIEKNILGIPFDSFPPG